MIIDFYVLNGSFYIIKMYEMEFLYIIFLLLRISFRDYLRLYDTFFLLVLSLFVLLRFEVFDPLRKNMNIYSIWKRNLLVIDIQHVLWHQNTVWKKNSNMFFFQENCFFLYFDLIIDRVNEP